MTLKVIKVKLKIYFLFLCLIFFCFMFNFPSFAQEIKTVNITIDTLTDSKNKNILSDLEIEKLIKDSAKKSFEETEDININHIDKTITIRCLLDESKGNIESLLNTSIFNYFYLTKEFNIYNTIIEIDVRYEDINGRNMKQHMYSYTYFKETLKKIDWNNISYKNFIEYADKIWNLNDGEQEKETFIEKDVFQLKIINILKTYFSYKLNQ